MNDKPDPIDADGVDTALVAAIDADNAKAHASAIQSHLFRSLSGVGSIVGSGGASLRSSVPVDIVTRGGGR